MSPYETMTSSDEPIECPLCMEVLEVDDMSFFPCTCGYQICRFCWHRLKTDGNSLCPACRKPYSDNPAHFEPLSEDEIIRIKKERRQKDMHKKQKLTENRRHLSDVRVVQKNLVFVVGLSQRLADTEVLKKNEYFGKFGKIMKVVINPSPSYAGSQAPSASAYVTYSKADEALRAIQTVNNIQIDNRTLKASLGTTKYCSHFLKGTQCPKGDCMYLHDLGEEAASFTKEEMSSGKHLEYESKLIETILHIPRCNQNITINDSANSSNFGNASNQTNGFGNASTPPPSTSQSTTPGPDNSNTSSQTYPSTTASNGHETTNNVKTRSNKNGKSSNGQNRASRNYSEHNNNQTHAHNSNQSNGNAATNDTQSTGSSHHKSAETTTNSSVRNETASREHLESHSNRNAANEIAAENSSTSQQQQQHSQQTNINENTNDTNEQSHENGSTELNAQNQDINRHNLGNLNENNSQGRDQVAGDNGIVNSNASAGVSNGFDENVDQSSHSLLNNNQQQNFYQEDLDFDPFRESTKALEDLMQIERNSSTASKDGAESLKNGSGAPGATASAYGSMPSPHDLQQMNLMNMANGNANFYNNFPLNNLNTNLINSLLNSNKNAGQQQINPLSLLNRQNFVNSNFNLLLLESMRRQQQQLQSNPSASNVNTANNSLGQQQQQQLPMAAMAAAAAMSNGKGATDPMFSYQSIDPALLFSSAGNANPMSSLLMQQHYQEQFMLKAAAAQAAAVAAAAANTSNKPANALNGVNAINPEFLQNFNQMNVNNGPGSFLNNNNNTASKESKNIVPPPGFNLAKSTNATSPSSSSNDSASSSSSATSSVNNSTSTTPALNNASNMLQLNGTDNPQVRQLNNLLSSNDNMNSANKFNMMPNASNASGASQQQQPMPNLNNLANFLKNDSFANNLPIDPSKLNFFNRNQPLSESNGMNNMMNPMNFSMEHGAVNNNASNHMNENAAKTFRSIFPNANISFGGSNLNSNSSSASGIASMNLQQLQEMTRLNMNKSQEALSGLKANNATSSSNNSINLINNWPDDPAIVALNDANSAQYKSLASLVSPQPQQMNSLNLKQQIPQNNSNYYSANNFFGAYNNIESNESLSAVQNSQQAKQLQQQKMFNAFNNAQQAGTSMNGTHHQQSNSANAKISNNTNNNNINININNTNLSILNQYQLYQQQQQQKQQQEQGQNNGTTASTTAFLQQLLFNQQMAESSMSQLQFNGKANIFDASASLGIGSLSASMINNGSQAGNPLLGGNAAGSLPQGLASGVSGGSNTSGFDSK